MGCVVCFQTPTLSLPRRDYQEAVRYYCWMSCRTRGLLYKFLKVAGGVDKSLLIPKTRRAQRRLSYGLYLALMEAREFCNLEFNMSRWSADTLEYSAGYYRRLFRGTWVGWGHGRNIGSQRIAREGRLVLVVLQEVNWASVDCKFIGIVWKLRFRAWVLKSTIGMSRRAF